MSSTGLSRSATQETFKPTRPTFHPVAPAVVTTTCSSQRRRNARVLSLCAVGSLGPGRFVGSLTTSEAGWAGFLVRWRRTEITRRPFLAFTEESVPLWGNTDSTSRGSSYDMQHTPLFGLVVPAVAR